MKYKIGDKVVINPNGKYREQGNYNEGVEYGIVSETSSSSSDGEDWHGSPWSIEVRWLCSDDESIHSEKFYNADDILPLDYIRLTFKVEL